MSTKSSSRAAGLEPVTDLDEAWATPGAGTRLRAVTRAAERLRAAFAPGPRCVAVRTFPLSTLIYPTRFALGGMPRSPSPYVMMTHRCALVQFFQRGRLKTLLFNPTDVEGARRTPYFARLIERVGAGLAGALSGSFPSIEHALARAGLRPEDVDYLAFDHLHTQDLRGLLGTTDGARAPRFPNATLLVPRVEWEAWDDLHPIQRAWFVPDGKRDVRTDRLELTDGDWRLGDGVLLLRTPGHTVGNQTLFLATEGGVWGISENGTSADNWTPLESRIAGLANACKRQDLDIVLNANTPEQAAEQYVSMALERALVDRVSRAPGFVQMFPSSEITPHLLAPGLAPTVVFGGIQSGTVARSARAVREAAS